MQNVTLEEMIGQTIIVGFNGTSIQDPEVAFLADLIEQGLLGGLIYFRHNIDSDSVNDLNQHLRAKTKLPPLLSLDQEGGKVCRFPWSEAFSRSQSLESATTLSARYVKEHFSISEAESIYTRFAKWLADHGFNCNFAPCVDLDSHEDFSVISRYERSFSADPMVVIDYARSFLRGHAVAGVLTCLKHFPGHGMARGDTHQGLVDLSATWTPSEYIPFRTLLSEDVPMLMASHLVMKAWDVDYPIGFSKAAILGKVRKDLAYDGVVVSDDLQMGAICDNYSMDESIVLSFNAGVDLLIFSNNPKASLGRKQAHYDPYLARDIHARIKVLIEKGLIAETRIREAYERVVKLKKRLL